ncbi:MAG: outer membrane protein transport protein [Sulfuricurvum sp.]|nr:outer membrane protein transport protein [Sulfuricurvum sp.]MDD5386043.1 outer membrane protein transport protein [Sulfuricurvum sp.]
MKRTIKLAVAAAVALTSTAAFATNGDSLIGTGAKARGMGGAGIGMSHGAESALTNPALITSVNGTEISFGGTVFMPKVKTDIGAGSTDSAADLSVIPEVSIAQKVSDNFYWGIGMFGTAGMGTDYRGTGQNMNMVTNLQLMQFAVPLAYKTGGFSFGVAPVLQYGSLDIKYKTIGFGGAESTTQGVAQDFGYGYNLGAAFSEEGLTVGASYKSAIDMVYTGQINAATTQFNGLMGTAVLSDHLEQPAEVGVGASYKIGGSTVALDFKQIKWGSAKGYKDFGWEDQNVYILGYQFAQDSWALRAGYNYGKNPIKEQNGATAQGAVNNFFNLLGFPAIVEKHYTVGGSYAFNKTTSADLAYVYVPEATETYSIAAMTGGNITTKHSQQAATAQLNFKF